MISLAFFVAGRLDLENVVRSSQEWVCWCGVLRVRMGNRKMNDNPSSARAQFHTFRRRTAHGRDTSASRRYHADYVHSDAKK